LRRPKAGANIDRRSMVKSAKRAKARRTTNNGEMAERFKAPVLTAKAGGRSEHRPQVDGQTGETRESASHDKQRRDGRAV
ncbi:MAG: hypothetical protein ACOY82_00050, partial [Pseudomonadota bacterium]